MRIDEGGYRPDEVARQVIESLWRANAPISGRRLAGSLGASPTTINDRLAKLRDHNAVTGETRGNAVLWSLDLDSPLVRTVIRELPALGPNQSRPGNLRVLEVTAVALERNAVVDQFGLSQTTTLSNNQRVDCGQLSGRSNWDVFVIETYMGNSSAAASCANAINELRPDVVLFVGIAGGLKPQDQVVGDVVVGRIIHNAQAGKAAPDGLRTRSSPHRAPYAAEQLARYVARGAWYVDSVTGILRDKADQPSVEIQSIASGDVVVTDDAVVNDIQRRFNDAFAVDMESHGFAEAAHRAGLPYLSMRGISDLCVSKNTADDIDDQPRAAQSAAAFAAAFVRAATRSDLNPAAGTAGIGKAEVSQFDHLPPGVEPWLHALGTDNPQIAAHAHDAMVSARESAKTWCGQIKHRPPLWSRQDPSGLAWAAIAEFAHAHGSDHSGEFFRNAAARATANSQLDLAAIHELSALISDREHGTYVVGSVSPAIMRLGPFARFCKERLEYDEDHPEPLARTIRELSLALDLDLPTYFDSVEIGDTASASIAEFKAVAQDINDAFPGLVDVWCASILTVAGSWLRMHNHFSDARAALGTASDFLPTGATAVLELAREYMRPTLEVGGGSTSKDTTAALREAERLALSARDLRRLWNGDSGKAAAVAAHARCLRGDFLGGLALLRVPPEGTATVAESQDPAAREISAQAALLLGDHQLALKLSEGIDDSAERELIRAQAFGCIDGMREARIAALWAALNSRDGLAEDIQLRILIGLARSGVSIAESDPENMAQALKRLREANEMYADEVEATAHLAAGRPDQAMIIGKRWPQADTAVRIVAEAACQRGDAAQAIKVLRRAYERKKDESLLLEAMEVALSADHRTDALSIAATLQLSSDPLTQQRAIETQIRIDEREGNWEKVVERTDALLKLMAEPRDSPRAKMCRWPRASALYQLQRFDQAAAEFQGPGRLIPDQPDQARLALAVLYHESRGFELQAQSTATGARTVLSVIERVLEVSARFPDDEEIVGAAINILMTTQLPEPVPADVLAAVQRLHTDFFSRFPETQLIQRISVGENLDELVKFVRQSHEARSKSGGDLVSKVRADQYPQGVISALTGRPYAELLLLRPLIYLAACTTDTEESATELGAAGAALSGGEAVIDTSALLLAATCVPKEADILTRFQSLQFATIAKLDLLQTRDSLALPSKGSLGWDPKRGRPTLVEYSEDEQRNWRDRTRLLLNLADDLDVVTSPPDQDGPDREASRAWLAALDLARRSGLPLWADDIALRRSARAEGVVAFGTLDLVRHLENSGAVPVGTVSAVADRFRAELVVDLDELDQLPILAKQNEYEPSGYPAVLLTRHVLWRSPSETMHVLLQMLRDLPADENRLARSSGWVYAAMVGAAQAVPVVALTKVLATMLVAALMTLRDSDVTALLFEAAHNVQQDHDDSGDLLACFVKAFHNGVQGALTTDAQGQLLIAILAQMPETDRFRGLEIFLGFGK